MNQEPYTKRGAQMTIVICLVGFVFAVALGCGVFSTHPELFLPAAGVIASLIFLMLVISKVIQTRPK